MEDAVKEKEEERVMRYLCSAESFMEVNWHSFSSKWETLSVGFQLVFIFFNIKSMV